MIQFVHTADIHFGVENYGKIDQKTGIHSRLLDFYNALNFCIDWCLEQNIDFFLFAGDAYKTANPSPTQQRLLMKCLLRLHAAGIPIVIVVGNHDHPLSFGKANALDVFGDMPLDGFHVISRPTSLMLQTKSGPVQIVGIPWPTRNTIAATDAHKHKTGTELTTYISSSVATIIQGFARELDPALPTVLSGHLTVSSGVFSGSEKRAIYGTDPVLMPSQLAISPFDYVALGHLHRHQNLNPSGHPPVVYAGSIERIDFGERKEDKGFCAVTIANKKTQFDFIKVPTRPFIQIEAKIKAGSDHTDQLIAEIQKHEVTGAVLKIIYHVPEGKKDHVDLRAVQRACVTAHHIAAVIPIHPIVPRKRRTGLSVDMDMPTLLRHYFANKPEWTDKTEDLITKALELENDSSENTETSS